ncbi:MAG: FISUMP domain-containing protein [Bacteroidota bacterium]|nr:FISUMP domain-containing protein [Bacteroidota bacterium]
MKYLITITLILLVSISAISQNFCEVLKNYRDNELAQDYIETWNRYVPDKQLIEKNKQLMEKAQALESDVSINISVQQMLDMANMFIQLSKDIINLIPEKDSVNAVAKKGIALTVSTMEKSLADDKDAESVVKEMMAQELESAAMDILDASLGSVNTINNTINLVENFRDKLNEQTELNNQIMQQLKDVKRRVLHFTKQVEKYQAAMQEAQNDMDKIKAKQQVIDEYTAKNCGKAEIVVIPDMRCKLIYDFGESIALNAGEEKIYELELGQHFLNAESLNGSINWDTIIDVTDRRQIRVPLNLKTLKIETAPVLVVSGANCSLKIDGVHKTNLTAGSGEKIQVPLGTHTLYAENNIGQTWDQEINIENQKQKVIKLNFAQVEVHGGKTGTFTDPRDGKTYKWVRIKSQVWMAENLNYNTSNSYCYGNIKYNCLEYGLLYNWKTAKCACPNGWHLPSKSEFEALMDNVGGEGRKAYNALKIGGTSGFSALFGGWHNNDDYYEFVGEVGTFWSSSPYIDDSAWYLFIGRERREAGVANYYHYQDWGFSVRCIKD